MPNLHDLLTASVAADVTALAGESAPRAVRARIGAVRTRRALVTSGGATLAVGAAAFAGIGGGGRSGLQAATLGAGQPATIAAGQGTIIIPLADATSSFAQDRPQCGDTVTPGQPSAAGFTLASTALTDGGLRFETAIAYGGDFYEDVTVSAPQAVVLRDGVVVAAFTGNSPTGTYTVVNGWEGATDTVYVGEEGNGGWGYTLCEEGAPGQESVALIAGTYEVVVTQYVHRSDAALAVADLERAGYPIASADYGTWTPGSIDCQEAMRDDIEGISDGVPVQCEPFGVEGITISEDAGTLTIPFTPREGDGDIEALLVSDPVPWSLAEDLTLDDLGVFTSEPPVSDVSQLACGAEYQGWWGYPLEATTKATFGDLMADGGELAIDIDSASRAQQAEISLDPTAEAWVLWRRGGTVRIAAHATATLGDGDLTIDRAVDYARTSLTLGDIEWCDDPFLTGTDYLAEGVARRVLIVTPSTITDSDGTVDHGALVVVELPLAD